VTAFAERVQFRSADHTEAVAAFRKKIPPDFKGV